MAGKKASEGIADLLDRTGGPRIKATVTVNQPYAQDQHETLFYKHPRGGRAKYLENPMLENTPKWMQEYANDLLKPKADAERNWADVGRNLVDEVRENAPVEFGDLKNSGGLTVKAGSRLVVDEPPVQGRLSESELDAKDYMRHLGLGYRE